MDEFPRNVAIKLRVCLRAAVSSRTEIANLVLDLHHQDSLLLAIYLAEMFHQRRKCPAVRAECLSSEGGEDLKWRAILGLCARETIGIGLDPDGRVFREGVFPASEPQRDQMKIELAGDIDPVIQNVEVEMTFSGFNLLPGNRHQDRIQVHARHVRQNGVRLRRCSCRGVTQFAPENEERFAVED